MTLSVSRLKDISQHHIWILNSYHDDFRLGQEAIGGIRETLNSQVPGINIAVHYMDTMRYSEKIAWPIVYQTMKAKLTASSPTFIIAMDNSALDFVIKYRDELFPHVPIVFSGVNFFEPDKIKPFEPWITGIHEDFSFRGTARIMMQLHPDLEKVVILHTPTLTGYLLEDKTRAELDPLFDKADVRVEHWTEYTFEELEYNLRAMQRTHALIFTGMHRDINGKAFSSTEAELEFLMRHIPDYVPIYSFWNIYDSIMIGGDIFDGKTHGVQVARKVVGLIRGVSLKHSPVEPPIVKRMFYYDKLVKFGIKEDRLPSDAIIVGKIQYTGILEKYGLVFLGITFVQIIILVFWFSKKPLEEQSEEEQ